ncbi:MAG: hypothetical protein ACFFDF_22015 [Candidatus Odinarchaeota archaeon]
MNSLEKIPNPASPKEDNLVFLKKKFENFGSEEILNEQGQVIGNIILSFQKLNKNFKIRDLFTNKVIFIEKTYKLFSTICYLKEKNSGIIAIIKKKKLSMHPSKIWFKNSSNINDYYAFGDFKQFNYQIINTINNNIVAKVNEIDKKKIIPKNIEEAPQEYFSIYFIQSDLNNFLIIAFIICINILNKSLLNVSDIMGFERKIARLRPFGPGKNLN